MWNDWLRRMAAGLCLMTVAAALTGCTWALNDSEQQALARCEGFLLQLREGDWEGVDSSLMPGGSSGAPDEGALNGGILQAMMQRMKYSVRGVEQQKDGSVVVRLRITSVDLRALLESLPEGISSKEEARREMAERAPKARTAKFDGEITLIPDGEEGYRVTADLGFVNAVTGGLYDILTEAWGGGEAA